MEARSMTTKETSGKKSAVHELSFNGRTAKRVTWESWEFTIVGPYQVRVTNASYGSLKDDHTYVVGVEDREGLAVPAECECKADRYQEDADCKHKVALATVGGPTVLNAATEYETPATTDTPSVETVADKLRADGGLPADSGSVEDDCDCASLSGFPCWDCYRDGKADLPE